MRLFFQIFFVVFLTGCVAHPPMQDSLKDSLSWRDFKIIKSSSSTQMSFVDFIDELARFDIVLLGEEHNKENQIQAQIIIINELSKRVKSPINLVLETLDASQNEAIKRLNEADDKSAISRDAMLKMLDWNASWSKNLYPKIIESALKNNANLVAGNLSKDEVKTIMSGALALNGSISTTSEIRNYIKDAILRSHHIGDDEVILKMVSVQQFRDRRMAEGLYRANLGVGALNGERDETSHGLDSQNILIAGKFHVLRSVGVPKHIDDFNLHEGKNKRYVIVFLGGSYAGVTDLESDYVVFFE